MSYEVLQQWETPEIALRNNWWLLLTLPYYTLSQLQPLMFFFWGLYFRALKIIRTKKVLHGILQFLCRTR